VRVWLEGQRVSVAPSAQLGQGGEAEVYDLGDGRALKLFKPPGHGDFVGLPAQQQAAAARLAAMQHKLAAFPRGLPDRVVAPAALATSRKGGDVVGYAMAKVAGEALARHGEVRWRRDRGVPANTVVAVLRDLAATMAAVHAAGVVIGDFNDLNVLVDGDRAWLIDADSFQYGRWPCPMFSERFVDPRLCDAAAPAPVLVRPHDRDSDAFALAVMIFRCLLLVGPYGGVHQPADPARRIAPAARPLRGVAVFDPDVVYPKAAIPWAVLPDELLAHFDAVFARGQRGAWPASLLASLRWTRCSACGAEHARPTCPSCRTRTAAPAVAVRGRVRATRLDPRELRPRSWAIGAAPAPGAPAVWLDGGTLWRQTPIGAEALGQVLAGHTRAWVGAAWGLGLWRAGGYQVAFTFRVDRRGLDERVVLPRVRGHLLDAHAAVGDDRAWLFWREVLAGRETVHAAVVSARGDVLATAAVAADEADWMTGHRGACAVGPHLFVPTDAGVVRVEVDAGALAVTRRFPDTADFVSSGDELFAGPGGLDVRKPDGAIRLELS